MQRISEKSAPIAMDEFSHQKAEARHFAELQPNLAWPPFVVVNAQDDVSVLSIEPIARPDSQAENFTENINFDASKFAETKKIINELLDSTVLAALEKKYGPPTAFFNTFFDGLYVDEEFSWREVMLLVGTLLIGGMASIFVPSPAGQAAIIIEQMIKELFNYHLPAIRILQFVFQITATFESFSLGVLSGEKLLKYYFGKRSPQEKYLQERHATFVEKLLNIAFKIISLASAVATNVITFLLVKIIILGIMSAGASVAFSWKGINDLVKSLGRVHPARKAELAILFEELGKFSKLPEPEQQAIMQEVNLLHEEENNFATDTFHRIDFLLGKNIISNEARCQEIELLRKQKDTSSEVKLQQIELLLQQKQSHDDATLRKIHLRLLTLSRLAATSVATPTENNSTENKAPSNAVNIATGIFCASAEILTFSVQSGVNADQLFKHPAARGPKTLGSFVTGISLAPCAGFGYGAGSVVFAHEAPLASRYHPNIYKAANIIAHPIAALSGGLFFTLGYDTARNFLSVTNIRSTFAWVVKTILPAYCYIGNALENAAYSINLLDEVYTHLAKSCADENTRRVLAFTQALHHCYDVFAGTNDENYFSFLKFKREGDTPLALFLNAELEKRMGKDYAKLDADICRLTMQQSASAQTQLPPKSPSENPSMWCRLWGKTAHNKPEHVDIEMGLDSARPT